MALVCDIKSDNIQPPQQQQEPNKEESPPKSDPPPVTESPPSSTIQPPASTTAPENEDLEDGEIEDDDDDEEVPEPPAATTEQQQQTQNTSEPQTLTNKTSTPNKFISNENKFSHTINKNIRFERPGGRYEDKKNRHLTEAEKSVMHLHKLERIEREKRERFRREQVPVVDDFASNIEKAIANVLKKDKKQVSEDEKEEEEKRGKKRKKKDKDKDKKKSKQRRTTSPKPEDYDEIEMMNIRKGSPEAKNQFKDRTRSPTPRSDYDSYDSSTSSDRSRDDRKDWKRDRGKKRSRSRNRDRGDDCMYSHEASAPMKLELCKFYLMDCCAKRDKCLYMHSEFPCKFYHTGLRCQAGDNCKFAHGKPLHEGLKQILFKHIETAPKEILGDFPRLSREGALNMINQAQKDLEVKYGGGGSIDKKDASNSEISGRSIIPSLFELNIPVPTELLSKDGDLKIKEKNEKPQGRERNRPSRWQDADPIDTQKHQQQLQMSFGLKGFYSERGDQDMRINSNGDIDMRTLPPQLNPLVQPALISTVAADSSSKVDINQYMRDAGLLKDLPKQDTDIRSRPKDVDIRQLTLDNKVNLAMDVDIRQMPPFIDTRLCNANTTDNDDNDTAADESNLEIVMEDDPTNQKVENDYDSNRMDVDNRIMGGFENKDVDIRITADFPANLPKKQRELFLRIQAQQKENVLPESTKEVSDEEKNIDWYSDDDDDCRLTIKDDVEDAKSQKNDDNFETTVSQPAPIKPVEVIEKLGDLSKIDISEEVTKLLTSISQGNVVKDIKTDIPKDPRLVIHSGGENSSSSSKATPADPRRARISSTENKKVEKLSIYEQGSISLENAAKDVDLRNIEKDTDLRAFGDTDLRPSSGRPDIDLRNLGLPFKAIQNYTPASEIDASINSHGPMSWKVSLVYIPRPDYTGLKLNPHEAQTTGDPRLRKIFRLSTEEKDSPASPKASPKASISASATVRADPRRRREEKANADSAVMNYAQQLSVLQQSAFYQSLTSSQKLLLNQELATKNDQSGSNDATLNVILSNLGLIASSNALIPNVNTAANTSALNILANVNNLTPMMQQAQIVQNQGLIAQNQNQPFVSQAVNPNILQQSPNIVNQMAQSIVQPGLLGAAPGVPNLPPDFQLNFDPRQGGLLGNAPPIPFNDNSNFNNYNDDYYEGNNFGEGSVGARGGGGRGGNAGGSGGGRGGFRDRPHRRGRNFNNNRNNSARNFRNRNSRSNRSRTPP